MVRAYRKNDYEGVVEGYIIETGVGFIISLDYNKFSQIFLSKKQKEAKRAIRKELRKEEQQDKKKEEQKDQKDQKRTTEADDRKNEIKTTNEHPND